MFHVSGIYRSWWRLSAAALAGLVAMAAVILAGSPYARSSAATGGLVVAFGDSYAAGEGDPAPAGLSGANCSASPPAAYCGHDSGKWTDSKDAYPNVLAGQLGDSVDNFAISGACASTSASNTTHLPNCGSTRPSVLEGELPSAAKLNLHPSVVTLTIGGNDVNFESCFTDVFGVPAINGMPCSDSTDAIAQIKSNVTKVLKKINQMYPGVPIVVTEYADPLPKAFSGKNPDSLCSQNALIYAAYEGAVLHKIKSAIATWASNDHDGAGIKYLNSAYSKAQSITQTLGNALNAAVTAASSSGVNAHAVTLNFASHGLCQDYPGGNTGWLLAPSVKLLVHTLGVVNKTYSYVASDTCAYADGGCSQFGPQIIRGSYLGVSYKLTFSANINDLPHPTIAGQQAIASQLMPEVTTLLGPAITVTPTLAYPWNDTVCGFDTPLAHFTVNGTGFKPGESISVDTDWGLSTIGNGLVVGPDGTFTFTTSVGEVPGVLDTPFGVYATGSSGDAASAQIELTSNWCAYQTDTGGQLTLQWGGNGFDSNTALSLSIDGNPPISTATTDDNGTGGSTTQFACPSTGSYNLSVSGTDQGQPLTITGPVTCTPAAAASKTTPAIRHTAVFSAVSH